MLRVGSKCGDSMSDVLNKLLKRFPFIDSVISLLFGAIISYLFQRFVEIWKNNGTVGEKIIICLVFSVTTIIMLWYYKQLYPSTRKQSRLEKEKEKSEIQRLKDEREMISSLYKSVIKAMENDDIPIIEKTKIVKRINLVIKDNKRNT